MNKTLIIIHNLTRDIISHTTPSLDLTSLMRSIEKFTLEIVIFLSLISSAQDLIGVTSSSTKLLFNILHPKSETVLKTLDKNIDGNNIDLLKNDFELKTNLGL